MMAVEVVQFLVRKYVDSLAEEEAAAELPFRAHFYDVKAELEKAAISSTNDDELRQCLYELNDLLAVCRLRSPAGRTLDRAASPRPKRGVPTG